MKNVIWEMSKRLVSEQRYLALKDSPKFQQKMGNSSSKGTSYIERLIMTTYVVTSAMMMLFSYLLVSANIGIPGELQHLQALSFIIYSYIFLFSLYSVIMYVNTVKTYKLLEPLKVLPTNIGHQLLPLSWFLYNGSSSLFIILPPLYQYAFLTGNLFIMPFGIIWAFLIMAMGYISGILVISFLSGRGSRTRKRRLGAFSNIARLSGVILIFVLFEMALRQPSNMPVFPTISQNLLFFFVPLLNVSYIAYPLVLDPQFILLAGASTAIYSVAIAFTFLRYNRIIFEKVSEQELVSTLGNEKVSHLKAVPGFYRNIFTKDVRNIFRKPQNATMMLIPIIFVAPTLFQIFFYSSGVSFGTISVYYLLLVVVMVSSSFYPLALIVSEGNGISVLQSLPLRMRDIVYSKSHVGTAVFAAIVTPVSFMFLFRASSDILTQFLLPANLIVSYVYASLFNIRRLLRKLPRGSTTVNFYSFGGNIALITLFMITLVFTVIPTIIATVVAYLVVANPFLHPLSFYLSALALNLAALFIVMNIVNRTL